MQPDRQCGEALAAEHDLGMLPAGEGQPEMIEPVHEQLAGDRDPEWPRIGEVGQALGARWMILAEDDLALGPMQRLPAANATFQGAADAGRQVGMAA